MTHFLLLFNILYITYILPEYLTNSVKVRVGLDNVAGKSGADELNNLLIINARAISI